MPTPYYFGRLLKINNQVNGLQYHSLSQSSTGKGFYSAETKILPPEPYLS
jgi:hypothetical protein